MKKFLLIGASLTLVLILFSPHHHAASDPGPDAAVPPVSPAEFERQKAESREAEAARQAAANLANPQHAANEQFSVGYFSYVVGQTSPFTPPDGAWRSRGHGMTVYLTVRNEDKDPSIPPTLRLLDETGRQVAAADFQTLEQTPTGWGGYSRLSLRPVFEMQSGEVFRGAAVFKFGSMVSDEDANAAPVVGKYYLLVSGGLLSRDSVIVPVFGADPAPAPVPAPAPDGHSRYWTEK